MRTAQEIYTAYRIMPGLQVHQLRVAAAGKLICDNLSDPVDTNAVVLACLLHDMGNIIKSDLTVFPQFMGSEGKAYWQKIKDEWVATYGSDEHAATNEIVKEIGVPEAVRHLVDDTRFSRLEAARDGASMEGKIVKYADLRAAPLGILSMAGRLEEGQKRYAHKYLTAKDKEEAERSIEAAYEIEKQIFSRCSIRPEAINDASVEPLLAGLRNYPVA